MKRIIAFCLSTIILSTSCNNDDSLNTDNINAEELKTKYDSILFEFNEIKNHSLNKSISENIESDYLENIKYLKVNGLSKMLENNDLNSGILDQVNFYMQYKNDINVYDKLIKRFNIDNKKEANSLINFIASYDIISNEMNKIQEKGSWSCAIAIAGVIAATAGGAFVTGGASLLVFLISKGIATASIIDAC